MAKAKEKSRRANICKECNKKLSKKKWYYRNGNYFCNKSCWRKFNQKQKEEKKE